MIEIKDEHIKEAEDLLIDGNVFETIARVPFIKYLNYCDLLAVPGSGKTTALLAKLYCLSKHLPFKDASGILVLSHTNAAIDEIKNHLQKHVPQLFEYPNFVGTVQSFVNKFLASPACFIKYDSYIINNDNDIYEKEAVNFFYSLKYSPRGVEPKGLRNKLVGRVNYGKNDLLWEEKENNVVDFLKYLEFDIKQRKILSNDKTFYSYSGNSQTNYLELEKWKEELFSKGILNYRDSFYIADWFIENHPLIITILQKRFKYVFIDEMQDLEKYQIDIIDNIFYGDESPTRIQRIGDINQSIYNSGKKVKVQADWEVRKPVKYLNDSNRLTKEVADVVNFFTLDRQQDEKGKPRFVVNGKRKLNSSIKPHLILFNDDTKDQLKNKFSELIKKFGLEKTIEGQKYGFKIIGWNAKWGDGEDHNGKLRLENIFEDYKKDNASLKETYDSLSKYLQYFDKNKKTLKYARKAILNALIHILRNNGLTYSTTVRGKVKSRFYTQNELIKHIHAEKNGSNYEFFKSNLFKWSFDLTVKQKYQEVYNSIKDFISNDFKDWLGFEITENTTEFIGDNFEELIQVEEKQEEKQSEDTDIEIGTVHSVKGQTHCATMYVETSYHCYETEKLKVVEKKATKTKPEIILPNPLLGENHSYRNRKDTRAKETLKMMYVGFSRPTHLLCFAALKDNIQNDIGNYEKTGWEIIDLT